MIVVATGEVDLVIDIGGEAEAVIDAAREVVKGGDVVGVEEDPVARKGVGQGQETERKTQK